MKVEITTVLSIAILACTIILTACSRTEDPQNSQPKAQESDSSSKTENNQDSKKDKDPANSKTSRIPSFSTTTVRGASISSEDLHGNVAVINFWGTWCPPCVEEIPHFQKTYERLKDKNLTVLGIAVPQGGRGTKPDVLSFMKDKGMTYPVVMHENVPMDALQNAYGNIRGLPTTFVLDGQGKLAQSFVGYTGEEKLKNAVEPLVQGQE